jgi:hypothetical protein
MAKGFINTIFQFLARLFGKKSPKNLHGNTKATYAKPLGRSGANLNCSIGIKYAHRSSQSKRRKHERRTGKR